MYSFYAINLLISINSFILDKNVKISLFFMEVAVNKILSVKSFKSILHYSQAKYKLSRSVKFILLNIID